MHRRVTWIIGICGIFAAFLTGCGDASELEVAEVHGRVTCNGEPVPGGEIRFISVLPDGATEGPPDAIGQIDENGNFTLTTYVTGDGAVLGKHQVIFRLPVAREDLEEAQEEVDEAEKDGEPEETAELKAAIELSIKLAKLPCDAPEPGEVTVVTGDNEFNFKLVDDPEEDDGEND